MEREEGKIGGLLRHLSEQLGGRERWEEELWERKLIDERELSEEEREEEEVLEEEELGEEWDEGPLFRSRGWRFG